MHWMCAGSRLAYKYKPALKAEIPNYPYTFAELADTTPDSPPPAEAEYPTSADAKQGNDRVVYTDSLQFIHSPEGDERVSDNFHTRALAQREPEQSEYEEPAAPLGSQNYLTESGTDTEFNRSDIEVTHSEDQQITAKSLAATDASPTNQQIAMRCSMSEVLAPTSSASSSSSTNTSTHNGSKSLAKHTDVSNRDQYLTEREIIHSDRSSPDSQTRLQAYSMCSGLIYEPFQHGTKPTTPTEHPERYPSHSDLVEGSACTPETGENSQQHMSASRTNMHAEYFAQETNTGYSIGSDRGVSMHSSGIDHHACANPGHSPAICSPSHKADTTTLDIPASVDCGQDYIVPTADVPRCKIDRDTRDTAQARTVRVEDDRQHESHSGMYNLVSGGSIHINHTDIQMTQANTADTPPRRFSKEINSNLEVVAYINDAPTDTHCVIFRQQGELVVSFRGTKSSGNAMTDMRANLIPVCADTTGLIKKFYHKHTCDRRSDCRTKNVLVHRGFMTAYQSVRRRVLEVVRREMGVRSGESGHNSRRVSEEIEIETEDGSVCNDRECGRGENLHENNISSEEEPPKPTLQCISSDTTALCCSGCDKEKSVSAKADSGASLEPIPQSENDVIPARYRNLPARNLPASSSTKATDNLNITDKAALPAKGRSFTNTDTPGETGNKAHIEVCREVHGVLTESMGHRDSVQNTHTGTENATERGRVFSPRVCSESNEKCVRVHEDCNLRELSLDKRIVYFSTPALEEATQRYSKLEDTDDMRTDIETLCNGEVSGTTDSTGDRPQLRPELSHKGKVCGSGESEVTAREDPMQNVQVAGDEMPYHVFITGHSLGGALATLCAYEFSQLFSDSELAMTVYTFGSPRVGNHPFAALYNAGVTHTHRIVNDGDPITALPPKIAGAAYLNTYKHVGNCFTIGATGSLVMNPNFIERMLQLKAKREISTHSIRQYRTFIIRCMARWVSGQDSGPRNKAASAYDIQTAFRSITTVLQAPSEMCTPEQDAVDGLTAPLRTGTRAQVRNLLRRAHTLDHKPHDRAHTLDHEPHDRGYTPQDAGMSNESKINHVVYRDSTADKRTLDSESHDRGYRTEAGISDEGRINHVVYKTHTVDKIELDSQDGEKLASEDYG